MKNEDKLKLAKKRQENQQTKTAIVAEAQAVTAYTEQRKTELAEIKQSIEALAETLQVTVDFPDLSPLAEKLKSLEQLPETFADVKNLSFAISSKLQVLVDNSKGKQITTVRGFAEANKRFENIDKNIEKFADLRVYLDQLNQTLKQGQQPEDYKPVRIVVGGDGTKLDFLKSMPNNRGGGGSSTGLTDAELRATPVPISEVSYTVSSGNSTDANLGISGVFTGAWESVLGYEAIEITLQTDKNSATNGAQVQYSNDGGVTTMDISQNTLVGLGVNQSYKFMLQPWCSHFRLVYTNGTNATTRFHVYTKLHKRTPPPTHIPVASSITTTDSLAAVQAILKGISGTSSLNITATAIDSTHNGLNTVNYPINSIVALPDGVSNSITTLANEVGSTLVSPSFPYVYNGTTWDRARGDATNGTLVNLGSNNDVTNPYLTNQTGTWGYNAGTSGTLVLSGGKRVLQITAIALGSAGSITINGGDSITIPYDATDKASSAITLEPKGNLTNPTIVFTGTDGYMVEYVS